MTAIEPIAARLLAEALDSLKGLDASRGAAIRKITGEIDAVEHARQADMTEVRRLRNEALALMNDADEKEAAAAREHRNRIAAIRAALVSQGPEASS